MKQITEKVLAKIEKLNKQINKIKEQRDQIINDYVGEGKQFRRFADFNHFTITKDKKYITGEKEKGCICQSFFERTGYHSGACPLH